MRRAPIPRHPCPCCGYRTLPSRGDYELCPVCWWEDDGDIPWQVGGPNQISLIEGQREFLADTRPYRRRPGKVRAPRSGEERDPGWTPLEMTPEIAARLAEAEAAQEREFEQMRRTMEEEFAANPEGSLRDYNDDARRLRDEASGRTWAEHRELFVAMAARHGFDPASPYTELLARWAHEPDHYRGHPLRRAAFLLRHARSPRDLRLLRRALLDQSFSMVC